MALGRVSNNIPLILVPPRSSLRDAPWLKTAEKVGLTASVVIAAIVAFTQFSILPAVVVTGVSALLGFALHSCFQRCFSGQRNRNDGDDADPVPFRLENLFRGRRAEREEEPAVRGRKPGRRDPRDRVRGGRDENENGAARRFGDLLGRIFNRNPPDRGNLEEGRGERNVGVGTREVTRPERQGRGSGRGNLGDGRERNVGVGTREVTRPERQGREPRRGNLGGGGERRVRVGAGDVIRPEEQRREPRRGNLGGGGGGGNVALGGGRVLHRPGGAYKRPVPRGSEVDGRGPGMPDDAHDGVLGRRPGAPALVPGGGVHGRGPGVPALVPVGGVGGRGPEVPQHVPVGGVGGRGPGVPAPIPGRHVPVGERGPARRLAPPPPLHGQPPAGGEHHVGLGRKQVLK